MKIITHLARESQTIAIITFLIEGADTEINAIDSAFRAAFADFGTRKGSARPAVLKGEGDGLEKNPDG